jgi:serine/threonine protein kinase
VLRHLRFAAEPLDPGLVSFLAHALASALSFAHAANEDGETRGIVHRDVSPSNVLLSNSGEVKLTDFGIAKAVNRPASAQSNALKGKIAYMAPEYALGRTCNARSDLFSLGVLLYECLAGFRPFDGGHDLQTMDHARNGIREPLAAVAPHAPHTLVRAVEGLIEPDPRNRPPHADAFLTLLSELPPPPLAQRALARLVRAVDPREAQPSMPGLASTRPAPTRRPRKRLRSRR